MAARTFAMQGELWQYLRDCTDRVGVRQFIRFGEEVAAARWDERSERWHLETNQGQYRARPPAAVRACRMAA